MKTKLIIAGIGNVIDIMATYILTQYYGFIEINPVMAWLLQYPVFAMISKFIVVSSILIYIWCSEHNKYSVALATFASLLYGGIGVHYIMCFIMLFFNIGIFNK